MKKFIALILLCFGLSIGANAQNAEAVTKADGFAHELATCVKEVMDGTITMEVYERKCTEIGFRIGFALATQETNENKIFLSVMFACLQEYCEQFEIDPAIAEIFITAIKSELTEEVTGKPAPQTETIAEKADKYAREMAKFIEDAINGVENEKEAENMGLRLGADLAQLSSDDVKLFRDEFYVALKSYLTLIDDLDDVTVSLLMELLQVEYDEIFKEFYE